MMPDDLEPNESRQREMLLNLFERYRLLNRFAPGADSRSARNHARRVRRNTAVEGTESALRGAASPNVEETGWQPSPGMYRAKTGTGPSRYDPKPLEKILQAETEIRDWKRPLAIGALIGQWESIVGEVVAKHCQVESFEGGELIVRADSSAWAQQLQLLLPQVHRSIDEAVGHGMVEKLIVRPPRGPNWKHGRRNVPGRGPRDTYG